MGDQTQASVDVVSKFASFQQVEYLSSQQARHLPRLPCYPTVCHGLGHAAIEGVDS